MYIVPLSNLPTVQSGSAGETSAQSGGLPFREVMQQAVQSLQESQQAAAQDTIMIHSAMETTAVEPVVQLPSRADSAYKEIMQMQI